jgi:hypothetical protein
MTRALLKTMLTGIAALTMGASLAHTGPLMDRIEAGEPIRIGFANEIPFAYPGEDIDSYQRLVDHLLEARLGLARYFTYVVTKPVKQAAALPLDLIAGRPPKE